LKGGFIMFDDFGQWQYGDDMANGAAQIARAIPGAKVLPVPANHPIWDSFYKIEPDKIQWGRTVAYRYGRPAFYGVFEHNDPTKRLICLFGNNLDISEAWEFSDEGFVPVDESNWAYKIGVNVF